MTVGAEAYERLGASRLLVFLEPSEPQFDPREETTVFLAGRGVPAEAIRYLGPVGSTAEEAGWLADVTARCGWRDVALVTSPSHTRRAGWLVRRAVGEATMVATLPAGEFDEWLWWTSLGGIRTVLSEWVRIVGDLPDLIGGRPSEIPSAVAC